MATTPTIELRVYLRAQSGNDDTGKDVFIAFDGARMVVARRCEDDEIREIEEIYSLRNRYLPSNGHASDRAVVRAHESECTASASASAYATCAIHIPVYDFESPQKSGFFAARVHRASGIRSTRASEFLREYAFCYVWDVQDETCLRIRSHSRREYLFGAIGQAHRRSKRARNTEVCTHLRKITLLLHSILSKSPMLRDEFSAMLREWSTMCTISAHGAQAINARARINALLATVSS